MGYRVGELTEFCIFIKKKRTASSVMMWKVDELVASH